MPGVLILAPTTCSEPRRHFPYPRADVAGLALVAPIMMARCISTTIRELWTNKVFSYILEGSQHTQSHTADTVGREGMKLSSAFIGVQGEGPRVSRDHSFF